MRGSVACTILLTRIRLSITKVDSVAASRLRWLRLVPEPERQDGVPVLPRAVRSERDPHPVLAAPERERPEAHVEAEGEMQPPRHVCEARRFPVRAAADPQPPRDPFVFRAQAQ